MKKIVWFVIIALVVGGGIGYWAGTKTAASNSPAGRYAQFSRSAGTGSGTFAGRGAAGSAITGTVVSADSKNLTVSLASGGSQIVFLTSSTTIMKFSQGSAGDLTPGTNVVITGTANSDGSMNAESIEIRPAGQTNAPMMRAQGQ